MSILDEMQRLVGSVSPSPVCDDCDTERLRVPADTLEIGITLFRFQ